MQQRSAQARSAGEEFYKRSAQERNAAGGNVLDW
jgi:hypothetical protein